MFKKSFNAIKKLFILPEQTKIHDPVQPRGYQGEGAKGWGGLYRSGTMRLAHMRRKPNLWLAHQGFKERSRRVTQGRAPFEYNKELELMQAGLVLQSIYNESADYKNKPLDSRAE